jgi:hypothetical protein
MEGTFVAGFDPSSVWSSLDGLMMMIMMLLLLLLLQSNQLVVDGACVVIGKRKMVGRHDVLADNKKGSPMTTKLMRGFMVVPVVTGPKSAEPDDAWIPLRDRSKNGNIIACCQPVIGPPSANRPPDRTG